MGDISYKETDATGVRPPGQLLEHGIGSASSAGSGATGACMSPGRSYSYWPWCIKYPSSETSISTTFTELFGVCCSSNICSETVADELSFGGTTLADSK